jgi:membrane protease YdiL (CAAX protease family)
MSTQESELGRGAPHLVRTALIFYGVLLAIAWLWRVAVRGRSLLLATPGASVDWLRDPLLGVAAAALVIALSEALTRWTARGRALARALGSLLGPLRPRECVLLAVVSGLAEEALFRGALQPEVGLWAASLLFGAAHLAPRRDLWIWSAFSLAAGLLFGALYAATGNLVAPAVAHFGVNAVNLTRLARDYGGSATADQGDDVDLDPHARR